MPAAAPDGESVPPDGSLPRSVAVGAEHRAFGVYLHVPFCTVRCGYCDFNTYTAEDLGGGADRQRYAKVAAGELRMAARVLADAGLPSRPALTVFFGGGTPTVLRPKDLALLLDTVRDTVGLAPDAEVTTEANPDSVNRSSLAELADAGFTRVSFGMQSAVRHVLAVLDRTHDPERLPAVVGWAQDAGLAVSLDLIYGTPGETAADWTTSLDAALACAPDHISAYALVVEPGTRLAARVRRGELPPPDDDELADRYEQADERLAAAGFGWYEVSNWARRPGDACRHNLGYWRGDDWWGVGPGAHSHVGGVRWWNVRHPRAYAQRLAAGVSPADARERLDAEQRYLERVLLGVRLSTGLPAAELAPAGRGAVPSLVDAGIADAPAAAAGTVLLTLRGRLLADAAVRALVP